MNFPDSDDILVSRVSFNPVGNRNSVQDTESLPTIDQIPTARASVAMLDKLWTQIDVLDDVKAMAETVSKHGSFFTEEFATSLQLIKSSQEKLLDKVVTYQAATNKTREEREKTFTYALAKNDATDTEQENEQIRQRMNDFFALPPKPASEDPKLKDFDELDNYINEVRGNMYDISDQMKNYDAIREKLW
ncbi:hypothetical protein PUMCH_001275 [Australozyma saopauloensis]|uniref:Uncharacterized protein n=1 Tax=Australozyma saopauloensis TaxID=291208 RepID=A0AAX4H722_9ASCO|nr:hypothetical protein PUMCH_001275 [[Candida] saopauloensis]